MSLKKHKYVCMVLTIDLHESLIKESKKQNRSISGFMRSLFLEHLKKTDQSNLLNIKKGTE